MQVGVFFFWKLSQGLVDILRQYLWVAVQSDLKRRVFAYLYHSARLVYYASLVSLGRRAVGSEETCVRAVGSEETCVREPPSTTFIEL
jgi:predicted transcriptional regulator with HTH domain